jgi:hypothetical protein
VSSREIPAKPEELRQRNANIKVIAALENHSTLWLEHRLHKSECCCEQPHTTPPFDAHVCTSWLPSGIVASCLSFVLPFLFPLFPRPLSPPHPSLRPLLNRFVLNYKGDCIVTEWMERGTLEDCLQADLANETDEFSWEKLGKRVAVDMSEGLAFLHSLR